ncbi:amidohydrolase family protein [Ancylobacter terrae]|uniref:amidohydrolase family protein n=1 Tax=Ancylobacter sp. sgz301288 TaxID=3342077 RepID=UPI00385B4DB0
MHAHIVPEGLITRFEVGERAGYAASRGEDGVRVTLAGRPSRVPLAPGMVALDVRVRAMEEQGVAAQVLSPWIALCDYSLAPTEAEWFHRAVNAEIAAVCAGDPGRYAGIGTAPLQHPDLAVEVLREAMGPLGLLGVEIATSVSRSVFLDDPSLDPFWAAAEALDAFIMIHPPLEPPADAFADYYLNNLVQNPLQTTVAGARLIFGGVLERFPRLTICLVHGGGFLPYNVGRLIRGRLVRPETTVRMSGSVEESFARLTFDTVTHSAAALAYLVGQVGADHVFLGSDYPFDMADPELVNTVRTAGLGAVRENLVLSGAFRRRFGS